MREYADELRTAGINVHYFKLSERDENQTYAELLCSFLSEKKVANLNLFEIEDKSFELPFLKVLLTQASHILSSTHLCLCFQERIFLIFIKD